MEFPKFMSQLAQTALLEKTEKLAQLKVGDAEFALA